MKLDMTESRAKAEGGASGSMNHLQELAARVSSARGGVPAVACLSAAVAREMGIPDDAGDLVVDEDGYEWRVIKRKGGETWVAGRGSL